MTGDVPASPPDRHCMVMGIDLFAGEPDEAALLVIDRALSGAGGYASLTGVHGITLAQRDPGLRHALAGAWVNFPDGAPVAWRQRRAGAVAQRIAGPDLMPRVIDLGRDRDLRHYLFGSTPRIIDRLSENLLRRYPDVRIAGSYAPPFRAMTAPEEREAVTAIRESGAHIVWVGLGTPKQDLWMHRLSPDLGSVLAVGVGAAFDFISGNRRRAPEWMQTAGLEWFHRMAHDPVKLAPRYVVANTFFMGSTLADMARGRSNGKRPG